MALDDVLTSSPAFGNRRIEDASASWASGTRRSISHRREFAARIISRYRGRRAWPHAGFACVSLKHRDALLNHRGMRFRVNCRVT